MKHRAYFALVASIAFGSAAAAQPELPPKLTCAIVEAMDCEAGVACVSGRPAALGAPNVLSIDLEKKQIVGPKRTTPIRFMEPSGDTPQILLQGTEIGYGWTLAIDMKAGTLAATLTNREGAFLLFGSCSAL